MARPPCRPDGQRCPNDCAGQHYQRTVLNQQDLTGPWPVGAWLVAIWSRQTVSESVPSGYAACCSGNRLKNAATDTGASQEQTPASPCCRRRPSGLSPQRSRRLLMSAIGHERTSVSHCETGTP